MDFVLYLYIMIFLHTADEGWNCMNPRMNPDKKYMVCEWNEKDFYRALNGKYYLYPRAQEDNFVERKVRKMFWRKTLEEKGL